MNINERAAKVLRQIDDDLKSTRASTTLRCLKTAIEGLMVPLPASSVTQDTQRDAALRMPMVVRIWGRCSWFFLPLVADSGDGTFGV